VHTAGRVPWNAEPRAGPRHLTAIEQYAEFEIGNFEYLCRAYTYTYTYTCASEMLCGAMAPIALADHPAGRDDQGRRTALSCRGACSRDYGAPPGRVAWAAWAGELRSKARHVRCTVGTDS
jgi:hypothetical protein